MKRIYNLFRRNLKRQNLPSSSTGLKMVRRESFKRNFYTGRHCYLLIGIILSSMLLTACSDLVSPKRFTKTQYTVNALLKSGSSISHENPVTICKVPGLNLKEVYVLDAIVTIKEYRKNPNSGSESDSYDILTDQFNLVLGANPVDSLFARHYYDPANHLIKPDYRYHLEVTIPGYDKVISADTIVPKAAEIVPNFGFNPPVGQGYTTDPADNTTSIPYTQVNSNYPVTVKVDSPKTVNFIVELYCREDFSTELEYTTVVMGKKHPTEADEDEYLAAGDTMRRFMVMSKFIPKLHTDSNWYVSWTDYRQAYVFYGKYKITALVLDDNYFRYRSMQEGYYHGGVTNALGCFGSASGGTMYTKIAK